MTGWIIALLSGALMSVQGVFNTEVTKQTGVWVAAGWVQATALLTCVVIWLFTGRQPVSGLMGVTPKYVLAGGVIGALITYTGDPQHGGSGAGPNFSSYRGGSDHRGLSDRAVWPVWSGKGSICME